jgi:uncharacterized membrane protein HdeD (DUF308 family)
MLEEEYDVPDLENNTPNTTNTTNQTTSPTANTNNNIEIPNYVYPIIGLTCFVNLAFSTDCQYKIFSYLTVNSGLYLVFAAYVLKRHSPNIELFTKIFVIVIGTLFFIIGFLRSYSNHCTTQTCPLCPVCQTNVPSSAPTSVNRTL